MLLCRLPTLYDVAVSQFSEGFAVAVAFDFIRWYALPLRSQDASMPVHRFGAKSHLSWNEPARLRKG